MEAKDSLILVATRATAEREAVISHVGRFVLGAAELDMNLSSLIVSLEQQGSDRLVWDGIRGLYVNRKLLRLKKVFPPHWPERELLIHAIESAFEYRNRLSHSALDIDVSYDEEPTVRHLFHRERAIELSPIDTSDLPAKEEQLTQLVVVTGMLASCVLLRGPDIQRFATVVDVLNDVMPINGGNEAFWQLAAVLLMRPDVSPPLRATEQVELKTVEE